MYSPSRPWLMTSLGGRSFSVASSRRITSSRWGPSGSACRQTLPMVVLSPRRRILSFPASPPQAATGKVKRATRHQVRKRLLRRIRPVLLGSGLPLVRARTMECSGFRKLYGESPRARLRFARPRRESRVSSTSGPGHPSGRRELMSSTVRSVRLTAAAISLPSQSPPFYPELAPDISEQGARPHGPPGRRGTFTASRLEDEWEAVPSLTAREAGDQPGSPPGSLRRELLQPPAVDLGHVDVAVGVDADGMRHRELAGTGARLAPVLKRLAAPVEDGHAAGAAVGHEEEAVGGEEEAVGRTPLPPLGEELALGVEQLDAVVLAVAHVDPAVRVEDDGVRQVELAFALTLRPPLLEVAAVFRKPHDPRVAVTVGDEELARGGDRDVGRLVEPVGACARHPLPAQGHQERPLVVELPHQVMADVGGPDVLLAVDPQAVGLLHQPLAPGGEGVACAVEGHDRRRAPMEDEDAV